MSSSWIALTQDVVCWCALISTTSLIKHNWICTMIAYDFLVNLDIGSGVLKAYCPDSQWNMYHYYS